MSFYENHATWQYKVNIQCQNYENKIIGLSVNRKDIYRQDNPEMRSLMYIRVQLKGLIGLTEVYYNTLHRKSEAREV